MITHITVEDAAKLISRLTNANKMQALTYIREAADRGEIQAADDLEKLQAENEKLRAELEQVKAEKDAAVESIPHECKTCVYHTVFFNGCTLDHDCTNPDGGCSNNYDRWKWRGPHKED